MNPQNANLIRLVLSTDELPPETDSCGIEQTLDYERLHLNQAEFLLPAEILEKSLNRDGSETDSRTVYSNCHEFRGESELKFEPPPDPGSAGPRAPPVPVSTLPPGLPFKLALTQNINTATAAAGDVVTAKLTTDIRDESSRILVPAGAIVTGRIVKALYRYTRPSSLTVSIKLESLSDRGESRPIWAAAAPVTSRTLKRNAYLLTQTQLGPLNVPDDDGVSALTFPNVKPGYVVPRGMETSWRTSGP